MRNSDILDDYKIYLYSLVENEDHQMSEYCRLIDLLFKIPFESFHPMDNNRISDAKSMRDEIVFNRFKTGRIDASIVEDRYISVLEVLIALARRMENDFLWDPMDEIEHTSYYFWEFLRNLNVEMYTNERYNELNARKKIETWVRREYNKDGFGSIFPMKKPRNDMRSIEIWNQLGDYVMENYL